MSYCEAKSSAARHKKKLDHTEIRDGAHGGHVVEHHFDNTGDFKHYRRPEAYPFSSGPEMVKHIMDTHGVKDEDMIAHLHGDNEPEPGGGEDGEAGADVDSVRDEEEGD
jgi:hypothetical protein